ncbi:MAG TPA: NlpC/P60 family protein [Gaiellales bacterium]|nr:NlpC/P60 family protein [Gaiellales bacterium]
MALAAGSSDPAAKERAAATAKQKQLNEAKQQAAADKQRLGAAQAAVASAQSQLTAMATTARAAIDRYDRAVRNLQVAQATADAARVALAAAVADVAHKQAQVTAFARASYMSGGPLGAVAVVLTSGGPAAILDQASLLGAVSQSQADMLRDLAVAQQWQTSMSAAADDAERDVRSIAERAASARQAALGAMSRQHSLISDLTTQQITVAHQLADTETKVAKLTTEQAAAQARATAAAETAALAASWDALQAAGDAMPWATAKQGRKVVAWAKKELGVPYSWGGGDSSGPTFGAINPEGNTAGTHTAGFDCSGLTLFAWGKVGFPIDHYTGYQWVEGHHIDVGRMRPGDLVFFATDTSDPLTIHHVGIYVGGDKMIDAPHTGANVRYDHVFVPGFIGAVRP